jgi:ATP-dependent Clp protease adaptor protein ClpS
MIKKFKYLENVILKNNLELEKPKLYHIIFYNDPITTTSFVIEILKTVYKKTEYDAEEITNFIHFIGEGIVATYPYEIAEQKIIETRALIKKKGCPLKVSLNLSS